MRRWLLAALLCFLAVPAAFADQPFPEGCNKQPFEVKPGKVVCQVYIRNYGWFEREVDVAGNRVAPDHRRWKLSLGFVGSDRIRTSIPTNDFAENIGEGSFLQMLGSAVGSWLREKDGRHISGIGVGSGSTAHLTVLTNNPGAFGEDESFVFWGSRNPAEFSRNGSAFPTVEFRPRLGDWKSRWRLGTQLTFSHEQYSSVDAAVERIGVTDVSVSPHSPQFVRVDGTLNRSWHREEYRANLSSWRVSAGLEYELVHGGPVDLSVEAGVTLLRYRTEGTSDLYQAPYLVFAPEVFMPDVDPARLLEGGETPLTNRKSAGDDWSSGYYVGLRADVFPFQDHLGINAGVRWHTVDSLVFIPTFTPELSGPFQMQATPKRWVMTVGLTLAWTHAE